MSVITTLLPQQNFELIRDRIGAILSDELSNQSMLHGNNADINPTVFIERTVAFNHSEMPALNVMLARGTYDGQTVKQSDGTYLFNVDVYHKSKSSSGKKGDSEAVFKLHRLLGLVRAILEHELYKTLGFTPPFIMSRKVLDLTVADPESTDAGSTAMGRVVFQVKVIENNPASVPSLIAGYDTEVKLELTDKGFMYSKPQP
jgi:hypothetical protein